LFSTNNVVIEANEKYHDIKQSVVLSCRDKMASIELLKTGTVDFTIVEFDGEKIIFTETLEKQTPENILIALNDFVNILKLHF
jgi:hypothetical protein